MSTKNVFRGTLFEHKYSEKDYGMAKDRLKVRLTLRIAHELMLTLRDVHGLVLILGGKKVL